MKIHVVTGTGIGPTKMAAFDTALLKAGVHNYNLIRLSSIIPPASKIVKTKHFETPAEHWGNRLYVVMADMRVDTPSVEAWAGIGWAQDKDGRGVFTEHEGESEATVRRDIQESLRALMDNRKIDAESADIDMVVNGLMCEHEPVCALAVAVFQAHDWDNIPIVFK